ncbi:Tim10/DDP family zinc finger-domain-containing protein [Hysterangium stoloniferum]|nr:Tim10/DDP family zinc finger-domain-containing protein [Hysterangium stoloniferum]
MSFLGGSRSGGSSGGVNQQKIDMAEMQMEAVTDMFQKLVSSCFSKCVPAHYPNAELTSGESICIDRCVAKYFNVNEKMGEKMQQQGQSGGMSPGFGI